MLSDESFPLASTLEIPTGLTPGASGCIVSLRDVKNRRAIMQRAIIFLLFSFCGLSPGAPVFGLGLP